MTDARVRRATEHQARHDSPIIDEAALVAARWADHVVAACREVENPRWLAYFEPIPDRLRDDEPKALRATALRCRAAYGVKDSIRDVLPATVTEPFLESTDRLLRELNRPRG